VSLKEFGIEARERCSHDSTLLSTRSTFNPHIKAPDLPIFGGDRNMFDEWLYAIRFKLEAEDNYISVPFINDYQIYC